jgi:hypothetical protein
MGYIIAGTFAVALLIAALLLVWSGARPKGRISGKGPSASMQQEPAADEPTPARSATASNAQVTAAQKRVPPA